MQTSPMKQAFCNQETHYCNFHFCAQNINLKHEFDQNFLTKHPKLDLSNKIHDFNIQTNQNIEKKLRTMLEKRARQILVCSFFSHYLVLVQVFKTQISKLSTELPLPPFYTRLANRLEKAKA